MKKTAHLFETAAFSMILLTMITAIGRAQDNFPTIRNPYYWPFAQSSIWNTPIGSDAEYVPAGLEPAGARGMTVDEDIIIIRPDAPMVDLVKNTAGWSRDVTRCEAVTGEVLYQIPMPEDFSTDPGYLGITPNSGLAVLMPDNHTIKQNQPFHRCGPGGIATSQYTGFADEDLYGPGRGGAHGGSGLSAIGGTIRLNELVPGGVIRHVMKINVFAAKYLAYNNDGTRGYRWPARNADGYASGNYGTQGSPPSAMEMGALLALKPDFDIDGLQTEPAKIIARAFMDYGAYIVDDCAWDVYGMETEWGPDGRVIDEFEEAWGWPLETSLKSDCADTSDNECRWSRDMNSIFINLHVVDNNNAENTGGGGTPRQPLAPEFGEAVSIRNKPSDSEIQKTGYHLYRSWLQTNLLNGTGTRRGFLYRINGKKIQIRTLPDNNLPSGLYLLPSGIY